MNVVTKNTLSFIIFFLLKYGMIDTIFTNIRCTRLFHCRTGNKGRQNFFVDRFNVFVYVPGTGET